MSRTFVCLHSTKQTAAHRHGHGSENATLHDPGAFPDVYSLVFAPVENIVTCETAIIHPFDTFWGKTL